MGFSDDTAATDSSNAALVVFDGIVTLENTQEAAVDGTSGALTAAALMVKGGIGVAGISWFDSDVTIKSYLQVMNDDAAEDGTGGAITTAGGISTNKSNYFA